MVAETPHEPAAPSEDACATRELWSVDAAAASDRGPAPGVAPSGGAGARSAFARLRGWIRERARRTEDSLALPDLLEPSRPQVPQLHRGTVEGWWSARAARGGVDEFLRERLARYVAQSGVSPERLPVTIDVESGRVVVARRSGAVAPPEWLTRYVRANGEPALALDIQRARAEASRAEVALGVARDTLAEARRDQEVAARAPSLAWSDGDATSQYGRPAVPPPWSVAIGAFVALMVLGNAWQFSVPLLRGAGVAPADIAAEASRRPMAIALPLLLALGASACLFIFSAAALRRARSLIEVLPARWQATVHVVAGGVSLAMAMGLAWAILVPGASAAGRARDVTSFLVAIALPLAAPPLLAIARRCHVARGEALRAAAAWDHVHRAALARWTRANAIVVASERECAELEAARAAWAQRFHLLRTRTAEVARRAADAQDAEASELRQLSDAIVAALERDRRAVLGHARARPEALPPGGRDRTADLAG